MDVDVVIVGGSIAGCTAAMLYGRAGLRVAVLEKHRDPAHFKVMCGHFILGGTQEMLRRNGLWDAIIAAGGQPGGMTQWFGGAWGSRPADAPECISLRREKLDPLLREIAAATPGVTLHLGAQVEALIDGGVRTKDGLELRARLVVGADGHRSTVAALAGAAERRAPNNRFGKWAYFRGVELPTGGNQVWPGTDMAIAVRTDDALTMLVAFPHKRRAPEFASDREEALLRYFRDLPGAPDMRRAERVSKLIGMTDYPCVQRALHPRAGVFLVGDAAVTGDPAPAVGCGWAFRSAEWLVESTLPWLRGTEPEATAERAYRERMRFILDHDDMSRQEALAGPPSRIGAMVMTAARRDPELNRRGYLYGNRAIPVRGLLNPGTLVRALWARLRQKLAGRAS